MLYQVDRSAVILKPTTLFLEWLNQAINKEGSAIELTLKQIQANCRVLLVEQKETPEEILSDINLRFKDLFELEIASWVESRELWPEKMDLQTFWNFFEIEVMDEVLDLMDEDLKNVALVD